MTGQRKIVQITNRLGHSVFYDKVLDIEIAYAQKAQKTIERSEDNSVTTFFRADNFDKVYY